MYRRPKFLEILLEIREQMSREVDYDVDLYAEMVRSGKISQDHERYSLNGGTNGRGIPKNEKTDRNKL